jgi:CHAT domain-containing protein
MSEKVRILLLSANPSNTSRIRVDQEAHEIFERLEEGSRRDAFDLIPFQALRAGELQRVLMKYKPRIVHFSGHGSFEKKIITEGAGAKGKKFDTAGLVKVFGLYKDHVRLVVLNACLTHLQAQALATEIDYTIGIDRFVGDKASIKFAGAFYRALAFDMSVQKAFESAQVELLLQNIPRSKGLTLFARVGASPEAFILPDNGREQTPLKEALGNVTSRDEPAVDLRVLNDEQSSTEN